VGRPGDCIDPSTFLETKPFGSSSFAKSPQGKVKKSGQPKLQLSLSRGRAKIWVHREWMFKTRVLYRECPPATLSFYSNANLQSIAKADDVVWCNVFPNFHFSRSKSMTPLAWSNPTTTTTLAVVCEALVPAPAPFFVTTSSPLLSDKASRLLAGTAK